MNEFVLLTSLCLSLSLSLLVLSFLSKTSNKLLRDVCEASPVFAFPTKSLIFCSQCMSFSRNRISFSFFSFREFSRLDSNFPSSSLLLQIIVSPFSSDRRLCWVSVCHFWHILFAVFLWMRKQSESGVSICCVDCSWCVENTQTIFASVCESSSSKKIKCKRWTVTHEKLGRDSWLLLWLQSQTFLWPKFFLFCKTHKKFLVCKLRKDVISESHLCFLPSFSILLLFSFLCRVCLWIFTSFRQKKFYSLSLSLCPTSVSISRNSVSTKKIFLLILIIKLWMLYKN